MIETFNTDLNFWQANPNCKIPEVFNKFYKNDKSKNKKDSSLIMWAISLLLHKSSPYVNLSASDKKLLIASDYLKDKEFKWEEISYLINEYERLNLSKAQKLLKQWEEKLEERSEFIKNLSYNEDTFEMLDKMLKETDKIWNLYLQTQKQLESEDNSVVKGGAEESLSEKGII